MWLLVLPIGSPREYDERDRERSECVCGADIMYDVLLEW